jgi:hypothetical protein
LSLRRISRTLALGRSTVRKFMRAGAFPERAAGVPRYRASALDAHEGYLRERWDGGCQNAVQLYRELRGWGFSGSETSVRYYVRKWAGRGSQTGGAGEGREDEARTQGHPTYPPRRVA